MGSPWQASALVIALSLLSACASQPELTPASVQWPQHQQALSALSEWQFSGKVLVKTSRGADSARLSWSQAGNDLQIDVSGPVGLQQVQLIREGESMRILRDGEWQTLPATNTALEQLTGWPLPLDLMSWWVRGIPAPGTPAPRFNLLDGRISQLQQAGWLIDYPAYRQLGKLQLPASLHFSAAGVEGKILFKQWQLGAQ